MPGDADIAVTGALLGDRARARIVTTLGDGRALPASVLADEAGIAASTASEHLAKLLVEAMARVSPPAPVTSLREGTRANALRVARTCYDHLAGQLGTGLMAAMISGDLIEGGDGDFHPAAARRDRLSAPGHDVAYRLTAAGVERLEALGVDVGAAASGRRPLVGYCVDWSEQRHHLAGSIGAAIHDRMLALRWISRQPRGRAVWLLPAGAEGLRDTFGFEPDAAWVHGPSRPRRAHAALVWSTYAASASPRTSGSICSAGTGLLNR